MYLTLTVGPDSLCCGKWGKMFTLTLTLITDTQTYRQTGKNMETP